MKNPRTIISLLILISFCIIAGGSFDKGDFIFILLLIPFLLLAMFLDNERNKKKAEKRNRELEEKEENRKKENENKLTTLKTSFKNVTKVVNYDYEKFIIIDEYEENIMLNEKLYNFRDIIDYAISDNSQVIYSSTISKTSSDTGSMLRRTIVGGVVGGGIGAIIGGSTASKTTVTEGGVSSTRHDYKISITINDLSNPVQRIELESNEQHLREIESLLRIIVTRNKKAK